MMVVFRKGEELRFIGHLDLMRTMQRALRRSSLPICYSNGFNPHIRLSFAAPLSVGVIGERELMEVPVADGIEPAVFTELLNAVLPASLRVVMSKAVDDSFPALMSLISGADYRIVFPADEKGRKLAASFDRFMALDECIAVRKTKSGENPCNIRPFVLDGRCEENGDSFEIFLRTSANASGMLKPSLWFECFAAFAGVSSVLPMLYRTAILAKKQSGELVPMEAL